MRAILEDSVAPRADFMSRWVASTEALRGDFELPERSPARSVELS